MSKFYVACDFGMEGGRVMLGTLHQGRLTMSEVRRFRNLPVEEQGSLHWNIPQLYREVLDALRGIGGYEEEISGISCDSWPGDYLLFAEDGTLITPTYHHADPRAREGMKRVCSKLDRETIYAETGVQLRPSNTLFQLGAERSRRLNSARHLLPVADGINYLLSGVPRVEMSLASPTQLYNPVTRDWSEPLLEALRLPASLFPPVVADGTVLGPLRLALAQSFGLEGARVIASCSHELAAALVGWPDRNRGDWAFLRVGASSVMGTELDQPIIGNGSRALDFGNECGCSGAFRFCKETVGLWMVEECRRFWKERERDMDEELLAHLAGSAPPFESLINPADPRFLEPGDLPLKIQAFCRETNQPVPRKPGPVIRCVLESLALLYRKTLREMEDLSGRRMTGLCLLGGRAKALLNHFTANALGLPAMVAPADAPAIGNVLVQALALGDIESLDQAREIARGSFKTETVASRAAAWDGAYNRIARFFPSSGAGVSPRY